MSFHLFDSFCFVDRTFNFWPDHVVYSTSARFVFSNIVKSCVFGIVLYLASNTIYDTYEYKSIPQKGFSYNNAHNRTDNTED